MSTDSLPAVKGYPIIGNTIQWGQDPFEFNHDLVTEVSDIAKFTTVKGDICILAHPDYAEQVLVTERDSFGKTADFNAAFGDGLLAAEGDLWQRTRGALDDFFYPQRINSYFNTMVERTHHRAGRWQDSDTIHLVDEMKSLALENIFATLFDTDLELNGSENVREAANNLNEWFSPVSWALPEWIPTPGRYRFKKAVNKLQAEGRSLLSQVDSDDSDNMLSALAAAQEEHGLTEDEIISQIQTFIFAGHDTTGLTLTYAQHLIGTHPQVRDQFYEEIDTVLGSNDPTLATVGDLSVTSNIINEAIRLYPPVHTIPRVTTNPVSINGYDIPTGTETHVSVRELARDPRFWDNPEEFQPDRWNDTSPKEMGYSYIPFGAGPRVCIGRRFALLEAKLVLAILGQQYRLEPQSELTVVPEMTTQPADSVPVTVRNR